MVSHGVPDDKGLEGTCTIRMSVEPFSPDKGLEDMYDKKLYHPFPSSKRGGYSLQGRYGQSLNSTIIRELAILCAGMI